MIVVKKMAITFEETCTNLTLTDAQLESLNVGTDTFTTLIPFIVWREILMGKRWRNVFMRAVMETDVLIGVAGKVLEIPMLDINEFSTDRTASESEIDTYGFCKDRLSPDKIEISVGDVVYRATRVSDILREDSPTLGWVRASLQKMGDAIEHQIDTAVRDILIAGVAVGNIFTASTVGTLSYDDVVDCKALMRGNHMYESEGGPFMLFIHPSQEADLLKETKGNTFEMERYSAGDIPFDPVRGLYAGTRVYVTENQLDGTGLIVCPPTHAFGPAAMFAWKRHLKGEQWRDEQYGRDVWLLSCRYGMAVVQDNAIGLISSC